MPDYFYQYNLNTPEFKRKVNSQIPQTDSVVSIGSIFAPLVRFDVPSTSEIDLDELMASLGYERVMPATAPTDQIALGGMQLDPGTGPFSQRITSTDQKTNFWNKNTESTIGVITADQANNELTIDSLFNSNTGDRYEMTVNVSVEVPNRDYCIMSVVHDDNGSPTIVSEAQTYGQPNRGPLSMSLTGPISVTSAVNQSAYINVRTVGGDETIKWHSGNIILKRL